MQRIAVEELQVGSAVVKTWSNRCGIAETVRCVWAEEFYQPIVTRNSSVHQLFVTRNSSVPVSYTHLRAHETEADL
eukprot:3345246-Rhodomonas_salina.1